MNDTCKAKTLLKEKIALLQESEGHLFGKKFRSHVIEIERSKRQSLEDLSNKENILFQKGPLPCQKRPQGRGR